MTKVDQIGMTIKWMLETLKVVKNWIVKIVKKKMKFFLNMIKMIENMACF